LQFDALGVHAGDEAWGSDLDAYRPRAKLEARRARRSSKACRMRGATSEQNDPRSSRVD